MKEFADAAGEFSLRNGQSLDVADLPRGTYVLVVRAENGSLARRKMVVE